MCACVGTCACAGTHMYLHCECAYMTNVLVLLRTYVCLDNFRKSEIQTESSELCYDQEQADDGEGDVALYCTQHTHQLLASHYNPMYTQYTCPSTACITQ